MRAPFPTWLLGCAVCVGACFSGQTCETPDAMIGGAPADLAIAAGDYDGFRVEPAVACGARTVIRVAGLGGSPFALGTDAGCGADGGTGGSCGPTEYSFLLDVADRLQAQGPRNAYPSIGRCPDAPSINYHYLHVERWGDADAAVRLIGERLSLQGLAGATAVGVEPPIIACPL